MRSSWLSLLVVPNDFQVNNLLAGGGHCVVSVVSIYFSQLLNVVMNITTNILGEVVVGIWI